MTTTLHSTTNAAHSRPMLRSVGAVAGGFIAMVAVTGIADQLLHWLGVFPPWGQVTYDTGPYLLAVAYRTAFGIGGAYLVARLAPRAPIRHALAFGIVGLVISVVGLIVTIVRGDLGPVWYPLVLVLVTPPAAWLGGRLGSGPNA